MAAEIDIVRARFGARERPAAIARARGRVAPERELGACDSGDAHAASLEVTGQVELIGAALGALPNLRRSATLDLARLSRADPARLAHELDLPIDAATRLEACFRLGRTVERARAPRRAAMSRPERVVALLAPELRGLDRETFQVLSLDGRHRLLSRHCASVGTLTASLVHPREVFGPVLRAGAAAVVVAHNHPSGDPEPSPEDVEVTRRLVEVGELVGVPLLDHVVLGQAREGCPGFVSMRGRGLL